ncbi:GNAT family N-acetyltransferase [Gemmatimonas groenlandica]|uniref:GNAT family N-acetyltransferase n=1 Tax=Gemmatimonas groenlandica TaxID=2732249 RepID=A0A6M4IQR6_9BACT|nr:GNAT family N-acetyltransferase [Gemmatimonas groenlandica]QJR37063.1 GNAT family N-acetyltransferase [Gemmatimonas groenlandica]
MTNTTADDRPASELIIRTATVTDAEALSEFAARVFHDTFAPDNDPMDLQAYLSDAFTPEKQAAEIADAACVCLVADMGGVFAGYALLRIGARDPIASRSNVGAPSVELQRFYVGHAWHGQGIAPRLMAACVGAARTAGGATLWLGVWERNARAIRFYAKQGFTDIGSQEFRLGSDLQTDRVMSRSVVNLDDVSA